MHIRRDEQVRVGLGRRGDRAHVEDRADSRRVLFKEVGELLGEQKRRRVTLTDVFPLVGFAQTVADYQAFLAPSLELRDQIRSDEAGTTRDDDH